MTGPPRRSFATRHVGMAIAAAVLVGLVSAPGVAWAVLQPPVVAAAGSAALHLLDPRPAVVVAAVDSEVMDSLGETILALGGSVERRFSYDAYLVLPPASTDSTTFAETLTFIEGVRYACVDRTVRAAGLSTPNDPLFPLQWGLRRVGAPAAWASSTGAGVDIAIIDTGIETSNTDFAGRIVAGINLLEGAAPGDITDENGHGTHVAGIAAAAADNGQGIVGVAPSARLIIVKALSDVGIGSESTVAEGIRWSVDKGAEIISMSLADAIPRGAGPDPMGEAVAYAQSHGVLVVAACGNLGGTQVEWPAAYPGVVAVAATDQLDRRASFSSAGTRPDGKSVAVLSAPGTQILSWFKPFGNVAYLSGTSMATPFVSGAAAVVWAANPSWNATQVADRLTSTALDLAPAGRDAATGFGRLRLDVAMGRPMTPDDYEPDGNVAEAAGHLLRIGAGQWHDLSPAGDRDVAFADLAAGHRYSVTTGELSGGADTALTVLAPDGTTTIASNDDASPGEPGSAVVFIPPVTGRYVLIVDDPRLHGGGYVLTVAEAQLPTAVSIRSNTSRPRAYRYFTLTGVLSPSVGGRTVVVEVLRPRTHHWVRVGAAGTSASGTWSRRYRATRRGVHKFRVRFGGDYLFGGSTSRTFSLRVR